MQTALTPKQSRFADEVVLCGNATEAARRAGYSERTACQIAYENLRKPEVKAAIVARRRAYERRLELRREDVIGAVLEAIRMAKDQGAPAVMIRGWVEIARMCGFYDSPEAPQAVEGDQAGNKLRFMSTAQLLQRIEDDGNLRNPDGGAMTAGQVDTFYRGLSDDDIRALADGSGELRWRVEKRQVTTTPP